MSEIIQLKRQILQSVFKNKLSESELEVYCELTDINVFDSENFLQTHTDGRLFFILKGSVQIKSETNESVVSLSSGFLGLSNLFPDILWQKYRIFSTSGLKVFYLDISILSSLITKYPALKDYFYRQALNLDLLLLHHYETANLPSERVDLAAQISSLSILSLESGVHKAALFKDKSQLILHTGQLIHSSGKELIPGRVYHGLSLPDCGEWMNLGDTNLFCDDSAESFNRPSLKTTQRSADEVCSTDQTSSSKLLAAPTIGHRPHGGQPEREGWSGSPTIPNRSFGVPPGFRGGQNPQVKTIKYSWQKRINWLTKLYKQHLWLRYILLSFVCFAGVLLFSVF